MLVLALCVMLTTGDQSFGLCGSPSSACSRKQTRGRLAAATADSPIVFCLQRRLSICLHHRFFFWGDVVTQDKFFQELEDSVDGFGVIAEHFGRGMLNNVQAARRQPQQQQP